uniref:Uncharacterized protein n=1 Tax=Arundo donax TaxID=35708 RepID=A0A0A9G647_ARUDO
MIAIDKECTYSLLGSLRVLEQIQCMMCLLQEMRITQR